MQGKHNTAEDVCKLCQRKVLTYRVYKCVINTQREGNPCHTPPTAPIILEATDAPTTALRLGAIYHTRAVRVRLAEVANKGKPGSKQEGERALGCQKDGRKRGRESDQRGACCMRLSTNSRIRTRAASQRVK